MSTSESSIIERISAITNPPEPQSAPAERPETSAPDAEPAAPFSNEPARNLDAGDAGESEATGGEELTAAEAEELEIGDLNGLAEYLNVDTADLYNIAVPFTKNGEKAEFTLGEIKDNYQRFSEAEAIRSEAQAKYDAYAAAEAQTQELLQAHALRAQAIERSMEQALLQDFGQVNWQHLQATNPSEYIRLSQQFNARQAQLGEMRQQAGQFMQEQHEQLNVQREHLKRERLVREQQSLLKAIPEWRDQKVADAERHDLARYMVERGYSEEEINAVDDHRAILLVRDAMRYRQQKASGDIAAKKVIKLAKKVVTPGTRQTSREQTNDQERGLRQSLKRTGSTQDAAALISARLNKR